MQKKITYLLSALVAALVLGGILYYFLKPEPPEAVAVPQAKQQDRSISFTGNRIVDMEDGKLIWELVADNIQAGEQTNIIKLTNLKGKVYRDSGSVITLTGLEAVLDTKTNILEIMGDVQVVDTEGSVFTAPKVTYKSKEKVFEGYEGVKVIRQDTILTGDSMTADNNFAKIQVKGNAKVVKGGSQP